MYWTRVQDSKVVLGKTDTRSIDSTKKIWAASRDQSELDSSLSVCDHWRQAEVT